MFVCLFFHNTLFLSYCLAQLRFLGPDLVFMVYLSTRQEAFTLRGGKRNMPKLPEFKIEQEPSLGTEAMLCDVHLKFQNWTPTLSPDLSHLHCSLPQFMASPSFLMLKPKILVISYSSLSLTHDIKSVRKSCWSHLQNIFRIWPLITATPAALVPASIIWISVMCFSPSILFWKFSTVQQSWKNFTQILLFLTPRFHP